MLKTRRIYQFLLFSILICNLCVVGQGISKVDSLVRKLNQTTSDTDKVWVLHELAYHFVYSNPDTSFHFAQQALEYSTNQNYDRGIIRSLNDIGNVFWNTGNFTRALETYLKALSVAEKINNEEMKALCSANLGIIYIDLEQYKEGIEYIFKAYKYDSLIDHKFHLMVEKMNLGEAYYHLDSDSSLIYQQAAYQYSLQLKDERYIGRILKNLGNIELKLRHFLLSVNYYNSSIPFLEKISDYRGLSQTYTGLGDYWSQFTQRDSSIRYSKLAYTAGLSGKYSLGTIKPLEILASEYLNVNKDSAVKYLNLSRITRDSIFSLQKTRDLQSMSMTEKLRQSEIILEQKKKEEERWVNIQLLGILIFILALAGIVLYFSIKKTKNKKGFAFLGTITLLLVFEFINLLIHPLIEKITHHNPVLMILILLGVAWVIVPIHHSLENWVRDKNQKRRSTKGILH